MRLIRPLVLPCLAALLTLVLGGCAAMPVLMVGDVLTVAEAGKTGFDMAAGLNTRKSLEQDPSPDAQAEARLRAILRAQGGQVSYAMPHVTQGKGYIVGTYQNRQEVERLRAATRSVKGVSELTLCLFPAGSGQAGRNGLTDGEVRDGIVRMAGIRTRDVRVHVVEGNAVLLGRVRTAAERERLSASARDAGAASVQNHVLLMASNDRDDQGRRP